MSKISIVELGVLYCVGVPDEERARPQCLLLTIEMECDFTAAARSDNIADTVDYYALSRRLLEFGEDRRWKLIEKLASDLADLILTEFQPDAVMVEVKKFPIREAKVVSVSLTRGRS